MQHKRSGIINLQIQSLRGLFCLMIVLYHMAYRYGSIYGNERFIFSPFKNLSFIALTGFFFISGFFANGNKNENGIRYFVKRVIRLYPGYFIAITLIFLFQLTGLLGAERSTTFLQYLLNIPFLNVVLRSGFVDGAHWYVAFLLGVYFLMALLIQFNLFYKKWFVLVNNIILVSVIPVLPVLTKNTDIKTYLDYYFAFSFGVGSRHFMELSVSDGKRIAFYSLSVLYVLISFSVLEGAIAAITLAVVLLACYKKISVLEKLKPLQYIGDHSFMVYLLHQNIGYMLINFLIKQGMNNAVVCVIIACISTIGFGIGVSVILKRIHVHC